MFNCVIGNTLVSLHLVEQSLLGLLPKCLSLRVFLECSLLSSVLVDLVEAELGLPRVVHGVFKVIMDE
jgi:hypothetical protein